MAHLDVNPNGTCTSKSAWMDLRSRAPVVDWYGMVWHRKQVPRFIQWMPILERLSTKNSLCAWGVITDCLDGS